jgi:hypothetical protein
MKVEYVVYKDVRLAKGLSADEEIYDVTDNMDEVRKNRYSLVSMAWCDRIDRLFIGCTNAVGDMLISYDDKSRTFESCGLPETGLISDVEAKIHKGIALDGKQESLYFGTATLSPVSKTYNTPGGQLVRYDIDSGEFTRLAQPVGGEFYQATLYDDKRRNMYLFGLPTLGFGVYNLRDNKLIRYDALESIPHIGAIDDEGGVWSTYHIAHQAFFRYLPDKDDYVFPTDCKIPHAQEAANVMYAGAGPIDSMVNGEDGFIYVGSALGELYRLNPRTCEVEYVGKPFPGKRLPALYPSNGYLYCAGGSDRFPLLSRYDLGEGKFEMLGGIAAEDGTTCYRAHELRVVDNVIFIGETDNPKRSGYLWRCEL